jgi:hypothetical protein
LEAIEELIAFLRGRNLLFKQIEHSFTVWHFLFSRSSKNNSTNKYLNQLFKTLSEKELLIFGETGLHQLAFYYGNYELIYAIWRLFPACLVDHYSIQPNYRLRAFTDLLGITNYGDSRKKIKEFKSELYVFRKKIMEVMGEELEIEEFGMLKEFKSFVNPDLIVEKFRSSNLGKRKQEVYIILYVKYIYYF